MIKKISKCVVQKHLTLKSIPKKGMEFIVDNKYVVADGLRCLDDLAKDNRPDKLKCGCYYECNNWRHDAVELVEKIEEELSVEDQLLGHKFDELKSMCEDMKLDIKGIKSKKELVALILKSTGE